MKFLVDECLSPTLVGIARKRGHGESTHVTWLGLRSRTDWTIVRRAIDDGYVLVSNNTTDFRSLLVRQSVHAGLVCLNVAPGMMSLDDRGYTASTIEERVRLLAGWTDWMHTSGFALHTAVDGLTTSAAVFKGKKSRKAYVGAGRLFIQYLQDRGVLLKPASPPLELCGALDLEPRVKTALEPKSLRITLNCA